MLNNVMEFDTIASIVTAFGVSAVGIVKISGSKSFEIINEIFSREVKESQRIYHGYIIEGKELLDEVIVLSFKSPKSFTGEDVIEIHSHGNVKILKRILNLVLASGKARMANKGEFTKRAFLNGKIDLMQAESVLDLIHSNSTKAIEKSMMNLTGRLSREIDKIKDKILKILSRIIASIDFPEEVSEVENGLIEKEIGEIIVDIDRLLNGAKSSNILRQGIKIAIVGMPNVGKSSLFNKLLNIDRSIVTEIAGTTRDLIQESFEIEGILTTLVDTAGIRYDNTDEIERIGIKYSTEMIEQADCILFLYDSSVGMTKGDKIIYDKVRNKAHIKIATKSDLVQDREGDILYISVKDEESINDLKQKIYRMVIEQNDIENDFMTNERHRDCLERAKECLLLGLEGLGQCQLQDLIAIDIKQGLIEIEKVTGEQLSEDILDEIFSNFCLGK